MTCVGAIRVILALFLVPDSQLTGMLRYEEYIAHSSHHHVTTITKPAVPKQIPLNRDLKQTLPP